MQMAKFALLILSAATAGAAPSPAAPAPPVEEGARAAIHTNAPRLPSAAAGGAVARRRTPLSSGVRRLDAQNVITQEQRQAVLDKHNELRATVTQPCTAADMETLLWDDALEAAAANWGKRCIWAHDDANEANGWGENLAFSSSSGGNSYDASTLTGFIQSWYDEVLDTYWTTENIISKNYTNPQSECQALDTENPSDCLVGHYTQVVWAKSNRIGCSVHQCSSGLIGNNGGVQLVCKYTPAGNVGSVLGGLKLPFTLGAPCAFCHKNCTNNMCQANFQVDRCEDEIGVVTVDGRAFYACAGIIGLVDDYCDRFDPHGEVCRYSCGYCGRPVDLGLDYCGLTPTGELQWSDLNGARGGQRPSALATLAALAAGLLGVHHLTR